jgi:hypothetical protein
MTTEEQLKFSQRYARFNQAPQGVLGKLLTFIFGAAFLVIAFMFSLIALAVVAVGGVLVGGWLWWKTRAVRKQMREMQEQMQRQAADWPAPEQPVTNGLIIEGEVIRETRESTVPGKLLRQTDKPD